MIAAVKGWAKRHWPRLSLRTYLFASLFLVAALPGVGAVALRVYENSLVRQTEAELVAQGVVLAASAAILWPGAAAGDPRVNAPLERPPADEAVDLSAAPILPERPAPRPAGASDGDARIAAGRLAPVLAETRAATRASILLLDGKGRIVAGTAARGSLAALPEVRSALAGRPLTVLRRNAAQPAAMGLRWLSRAAAIRVHHARAIRFGGRPAGVLLLSQPARSLFNGLYQDWGKIAIGVAAILFVLVLLSGLLSRGIARPIEALRQASHSLARGEGRVPEAPPTAAVEIQDLYRDFAAMAVAIALRSRYLRDFAHAVSHEFKTPLAGIRGAIELLGDHADTMSAADRRRFLANADADATRLTLLVSRLLDLARADMQPAGPADRTDAAAAARRVADALARPGNAITVREDAALPPVGCAAATLEAVLTTLVENSIQAGARSVAVVIAPDEKGGASLTVTDDGAGIPPADRDRVFEPFFTSRRASGGTGLGLSIAQSLLVAAGGELQLLEGGRGAVFALRLPLAGG